jgi:hypothetical protein
MSESSYSDNYENYDYDDYNDNDNDDENKYRDSYSFSDYLDLIAVSEYMDNPDLDKITNIINALIKANKILNCIETSFNFDFTFGEYSKWVEIAKIFNENDEINNDYIILIDETSIVCKYTKY